MDDVVVITGIGLVTPLGCSSKKTWSHVRTGDSVAQVQNAIKFPEDMGDFVRTAPFISPRGTHRIFPMALSAVSEALHQAQLDLKKFSPEDLGCSVSVSKPIFLDGQEYPYYPDSVNQYLMEKFRIEGFAQNYVAACATGIHSLLAGASWIKSGLCKAVIVGACEASLNPLIISGFKNLGVLSKTPKPFDLSRDGFVMGEGAGVFILEKKSDALARGAKICAEIAGGAVGSDTHHPVKFKEDGSTIASVIGRALKSTGAEPHDLDYVNLHGTGTVFNDLIETRAVKRAFGDEAEKISFSSTKGSTGHLLGAAGSVEAAITCLALRDQFVPPTANLSNPDPECDLNYTPKRGVEKHMKLAMSLSFGFGGPIGAIVFKAA